MALKTESGHFVDIHLEGEDYKHLKGALDKILDRPIGFDRIDLSPDETKVLQDIHKVM
jgi:hypothetical protein